MRLRYHLPYWLIIVGFTGWLVWEKTLDPERDLHRASTNTLKIAGNLLEGNIRTVRSEIKLNTEAYLSTENGEFMEKSQRLSKNADLISKCISELGLQVHAQTIRRDELGAKIQKLTSDFRDSLRVITQDNSGLQASFPDLLLESYEIAPDWLMPYLKTANSDALQLILRNIQVRVSSIEMAVLYNWNRTVSSGDVIVCNFGPIIGLSPENAAPKVGDWYSADLFAYLYERPKVRNTRFLINGEELEVKNEVAQFRHRFTSAGLKKLKAEIILTNPHTKEVSRFMKEFAVTVVDTCR